MYGHQNGSEEVRGFFGVPGDYWNPPGKLMGLMGHSGERKEGHKRWSAPPPAQSELDKGWGRGPPFLLPLLSFPFPPLHWKEGEGSNPTRSGVLVGRSPLGAPPPGRPPPPPLLYIQGRGAPQRHKSWFLSRVRCPPPPFTPPVIAS